jgi:hypothetical protein
MKILRDTIIKCEPDDTVVPYSCPSAGFVGLHLGRTADREMVSVLFSVEHADALQAIVHQLHEIERQRDVLNLQKALGDS